MSYRRLQLRRGKKADMPTLAVGEIAFTTDENKLYVGDGTTNHCVSSTNDYTTAEKNKVANLPSNTNTELSKKANKATIKSTKLLASGWSGSKYTFESTYPVKTYDIEIALDNSATDAQAEAFNAAQIASSASVNTIRAYGIVPTVDIPICIKAVKK